MFFGKQRTWQLHNVRLHRDLSEELARLAKAHGESLESYIESVLREKTCFAGPKHGIYTSEMEPWQETV